MYIRRVLEDVVLELTRSFPVVMVTGPRQVGKSTMLQHLVEREGRGRRIVTLDELGPRMLALEDPELFVQRYPPPVLIDEVQHAPELLDRIKARVDRSRAHGEYWLTGSQRLPLLRRAAESLAGRVGLTHLGGLSTAEACRREVAPTPFRPDRLGWSPERRGRPLLEVFHSIVNGSMPRMAHDDAPPWEAFYGSYLQTYVERDVRSMLQVSDLAAFQRFLKLAAARVGQLVNYSDLARDTGIAVSTAKEWMAVLEATSQILMLRPYFKHLSSRQIKTPKLYFMDTGMACYLAGWKSAETAASGAMAGSLLECHVVSEIVRSYRHRGVEPPIYFWRDKERNEVDVILDEDGVVFPIEVKLGASPGTRDLRGIDTLRRHTDAIGNGAVACLTETPYPLRSDVEAIPVDAIV
jgi:predicted AAA+ superfamily ATPase